MGRKTPEKKATGGEERERERDTSCKDTKKEKKEEEEESGQHWEGEADGVWHTPHAIIME